MRAADLAFETGSALLANKGRSLLTVLGVVIGIAAVIAMTSLIGGIKQSLVSELGLDQSRVIEMGVWGAQPTTLEDLSVIEENVDGYEFVTGAQYSGAKVSSGTRAVDAQVLGVGDRFFTAMGAKLVAGRLIESDEVTGGAMVVVIDQGLARELFKDESAVGKSVKVGEDSYTVVGVVEASGMFASQGTAYLPFNTCAMRVSGLFWVDTIVGFAREGADVEDVAARTEAFIRQHWDISPQDQEEGSGYVYVQTMQSIQDELDATMMSFQMIMTAVAGISLLVGGIGIMNMMLTNVTERIREIGLRKALGARRRDITLQFLMESIAITMAGGVIGTLVGYAGAWALSGVASSLVMEGAPVHPYFSVATIAVVVAICVGIGVVFGFGPARRAARLDPVESLHYQ